LIDKYINRTFNTTGQLLLSSLDDSIKKQIEVKTINFIYKIIRCKVVL